jgi:zinc resistance-associated protein
MRKLLLASVAIASVAGSTFVLDVSAALGDQPVVPYAAELQRSQERHAVLLDAHLAAMKAALKLTAEQEKYWPAFEAAVRDAEKARADRWGHARERMETGDRPSPIERMTIMSAHLQSMGTQLKAVADASKPLYDSLTDGQKRDFGPLMRDFKPRGQH